MVGLSPYYSLFITLIYYLLSSPTLSFPSYSLGNERCHYITSFTSFSSLLLAIIFSLSLPIYSTHIHYWHPFFPHYSCHSLLASIMLSSPPVLFLSHHSLPSTRLSSITSPCCHSLHYSYCFLLTLFTNNLHVAVYYISPSLLFYLFLFFSLPLPITLFPPSPLVCHLICFSFVNLFCQPGLGKKQRYADSREHFGFAKDKTTYLGLVWRWNEHNTLCEIVGKWTNKEQWKGARLL